MSALRRVAVTGVGALTPAGPDARAAFDSVMSAKSVARLLDGHALSAADPPPLGCTVTAFDPAEHFGPRELPVLDRSAVLGVTAALEAFADSGLAEDGVGDPARCGVMVGASGITSGVVMSELLRGPGTPDAFSAVRGMPNGTAAAISVRLKLHGPSSTYSTACASGTTALGEAMRQIQYGRLDVAVAGGADAPLDPVSLAAFGRIGATSSRRDAPEEASRPFDVDRDGFVMGEGAAFLILEDYDRAVARGARVYAEAAGYGANCDAFHPVMPRRDGASAAACMTEALADAGIAPGEIGHINAHGTSTPRNDQAEARAIEAVFGADAPPVTAPKGVVGHMFGAAGAFEALVSVLGVTEGTVPPVANHRRADDGTTLDVVTGEPRRIGPAPVISNSFGFGGHNTSIVFRPV
ncbi:beta-ketoacyl-[acyl-carrier-protein] synthase family protein [Streptomyces sp. CRN 30]|uniref:beta-ketoacyl-[acyl-carrier-protein] synthase family protein n=1 Tax=Streptomyces sp. CRN 30 TaxID=3075613 RepID=UPI002A82589D|nr:beta-ketoacyl-[acyl-carrier-protein] synthase family protein [Streptomyces sp. CRN 30]